jgi:DNA-binding CsgD family transcriptional regulator
LNIEGDMKNPPQRDLVDTDRDLILLEHIEQNPEATQASLAAQLGVAVGTVNWHLKRLIAKGYLKASRLERRKLRYIITPEGLALRARLTLDYIQSSFRLYRLVRERSIHRYGPGRRGWVFSKYLFRVKEMSPISAV